MKTTSLSDKFDYEDFQERYGGAAIPLFLISENKDLTVVTGDSTPKPRPGQTLIALVQAEPKERDETSRAAADTDSVA